MIVGISQDIVHILILLIVKNGKQSVLNVLKKGYILKLHFLMVQEEILEEKKNHLHL